MKLKLAIEPRPASTWGMTLANLLPRDKWDRLRFDCYREAGYACEICGRTDLDLNAHEIWEFDDRRKIMRLKRIECRCTLCHDVHHFGRSTQVHSRSYQKKLIEHWCKVNERTKEDFQQHLADIFEINKKRANIFYIVKVGRYILT